VIANLTRKLVRLEEENERMKDDAEKREHWLREAKREAGFHEHNSFDAVWDAVLKVYKSANVQAPPV
jgi:hypothetical protein